MDKGNYTGRRVDFSKHAAAVFQPHLFTDEIRPLLGCGASALALVTGVLPEVIHKHNRWKTHYADAFMLRFLHRRGFTALPLTQCNLSASSSPVGRTHVVLLSQLFKRNEATWGVIFNAMYYHNFEIYHLDSFAFLNKPILSAYLLSCPRWRLDHLPKPAPTPVPKAKMGKLTLRDILQMKPVPQIVPEA